MLYSQISDAVVKQMKQAKESNLFKFLSTNDLTQKATDYFKELLNFNLDYELYNARWSNWVRPHPELYPWRR